MFWMFSVLMQATRDIKDMRTLSQSSAFFLAVIITNETHATTQASFSGSLRSGRASNSTRSTKVNNFTDILPILQLWFGLHGMTINTNYFVCTVYLHSCGEHLM